MMQPIRHRRIPYAYEILTNYTRKRPPKTAPDNTALALDGTILEFPPAPTQFKLLRLGSLSEMTHFHVSLEVPS